MNWPATDRTRDETIADLVDRPLDVLIIGGGIVGAGVARDAAMRGLRVGLVEQSDFASGTSSRSSRLLHGGLRYLAQGRVGLVRQAGREKRILRRIAPYLCSPLRFVFPSYHNAGLPMWKLGIGVKAYDLICGNSPEEKSESLDPSATAVKIAGIETRNLGGAVRYSDFLTCDSRLVLDTLRSSAAHGANIVNYARLADARRDGKFWRFEIRDTMKNRSIDGEATTIVNAAGPWGDRFPASQIKLRLTKGVHLVVDRSRLPIHDALVMPQESRILFAIPWGPRVILGTTDTDFTGDPAQVRCDATDAKYVLDIVNDAFPGAKLGAADILATWAGVRPLIADPRGGPSDLSRAHVIKSHDGWIDVAGGKLTTYRLMAEQTVNLISRNPCRTSGELLPAGEFTGVLPPAVSREAVEHCCRNEWSVHLDDVMIRRTSWAYANPESLDAVAGWMAAELRWMDEQKAAELRRYRDAIGIQ